MTHLGEAASALVDQQLTPAAAEQACAHLAGCPECRRAVQAERQLKEQLVGLRASTPSPDLTARLLMIGGPLGPVPPRPALFPGAPRPELALFRLPGPTGREDARRPMLVPRDSLVRARRRAAAAAAMAGALTVVGLGVAGSMGIAASGALRGDVRAPAGTVVFPAANGTSELPAPMVMSMVGGRLAR